MRNYNRLYKVLSIFIILGLLLSSWHAPLWAEMLSKDTAYTSLQSTNSTAKTTTMPSINAAHFLSSLPGDLSTDRAGLNGLVTNGESTDILLDIAALETSQQSASPTEPASLHSPLTVSRVQSAYSTSAVVNNTIVVTFTITNNQPPINFPEIDPNATITDTIDATSDIDFNNDPIPLWPGLQTEPFFLFGLQTILQPSYFVAQ